MAYHWISRTHLEANELGIALSLLRALDKSSIAKIKSEGQSGSPYLSLLVDPKKPFLVPLIRTKCQLLFNKCE